MQAAGLGVGAVYRSEAREADRKVLYLRPRFFISFSILFSALYRILMFPLYTIGLLGGYPATTDTVEYFKFTLQYYCGSMSAFRLLVAVSAPDDLMFCHALLELKKTVPGLQLTMVVRENTGKCEFNIFNKRTAGASIAARFQKALVGIPIPVQHELCDPGFFVLCTPYPIECKEYLNPDSRHYDPYAELRQSIEYIQRHKFKVKTNRLPQVFLRQWLTPPPRKAYLLLWESALGSLPERTESDIETSRPVPTGSIRNRNTGEQVRPAFARHLFAW